MQPPPLPPPNCQLCEQPAEPGYSVQLCSVCRTKLSKRPFPLWIKLAIILVAVVFVYALAKTPASLVASIAFERGQRAEADGNYGTAAKEYAKAVEKFPDSISAVARLGIAQYRAGDHDAAAQTLDSLAGRQAPKELMTEINAVIAEMRKGGTSFRYSADPTQSPITRSSSPDILDRWIAENLPSATPLKSRTQTTARPAQSPTTRSPSPDIVDRWIAENLPSARPLNSKTQTTARPVKAGGIVADVGGTKINIPPPTGFFRFDGNSNRVDAQLKSGLASTNKLLAAFASDSDLAMAMKDEIPELRHWFFAQSLINAGYFTDASWTRLKSNVRSDLHADMEKLNSSELWAKLQSSLASASKELGMEFGGANVVPLEVFDEDERSLCYSVLMKSQYRAPDFEKPVTVIHYESAATVYVRQRVIYLYSCAVFEDKSDADWARTSLQRWRDAVVAENQ